MTVAELIAELAEVEDLDATITLVAGENNGNCTIFNDKITIQQGFDTDNNMPFVEICSFFGKDDSDE